MMHGHLMLAEKEMRAFTQRKKRGSTNSGGESGVKLHAHF
jgi:hypothetical protein